MPATKSGPSSNRLSRVYLLLAFFLGCCFAILVFKSKGFWAESKAATNAPSELHQSAPIKFNVCRGRGFQRIKPLSVERIEESVLFNPLKTDLAQLVNQLQHDGAATNISVYIREFDQRGWMALNPEERYHPASLMKVALLIAYLQIAQADPQMLKKELVYNKPVQSEINTQFYTSKSIHPGKKYTIHNLLYYMIAYSDNNATWLLASHFDNSRVKKLFADFCLPEPVEDDLKFTLTAKEISVFCKAIYSSACLSPEFSEYAADMMSESSFQEGFVKGFPPDTKMWHKFGEWRSVGHDFELHESGLVFIKDKPYLITVMTKGKDTERLAGCIQAVCKVINEKISSP